jgi:hypothetical protein
VFHERVLAGGEIHPVPIRHVNPGGQVRESGAPDALLEK